MASCGYVCAIGEALWGNEHLQREIPEFAVAYAKQRAYFGQENESGQGLFHSFILWFLVRMLRPELIVESGVLRGQTSWLLVEASKAWRPSLVRIDPLGSMARVNRTTSGMMPVRPWTPEVSPSTAAAAGFVNGSRTELLDKYFVDFSRVRWQQKLAALGVDPAHSLVVFDDHQDQLTRVEQASGFGFRHLVFDDNFIPGVGDAFSLKNACDGGLGGESGGGMRDLPSSRSTPPSTKAQQPTDGSTLKQGCGGGLLRKLFGGPVRCTDFHKHCSQQTSRQLQMARIRLLSLVEVLWEGPPLAPINDPYGQIRPLISGGGYQRAPHAPHKYEGPTAAMNGIW